MRRDVISPFKLDVHRRGGDRHESEPQVEPQRGIVARPDHQTQRQRAPAHLIHQSAHDCCAEPFIAACGYDRLIDEMDHIGGAVDDNAADGFAIELDDVEASLGKLYAIALRLRFELMAHQVLARLRIDLHHVPLGRARLAEQSIAERLVFLALRPQRQPAERRRNGNNVVHAAALSGCVVAGWGLIARMPSACRRDARSATWSC
jgi:hypothetical protein